MAYKQKYFVASCSGGKDSVAMVLRLMEEGKPLTHVVFYDSGMEFDAIYRVIDMIRNECIKHGVTFVYLKAKTDFLQDMLLTPITGRNGNEHYGYDWCGGICRWRTGAKITAISEFLNSLSDGEIIQYIGIACDEPHRIKDKDNVSYPLVEWNMTEADCLAYCRKNNVAWLEGDIDLYDILKRVSCWCCKNKNLEELRAYYHYLPKYWGLLKGMQSRIDRPFYNDKTIFELEERFEEEDAFRERYYQVTLEDLIATCLGE